MAKIDKEITTSGRLISCSYYTHFNRPPLSVGERSVGKSKTTTLGYVDQAVLVEQMIKAGETLTLIRMLGQGKNYDVPADADPSTVNIPLSRMKDFDLVDLHKLQQSVYDKMREMYKDHLSKQDAVGEATKKDEALSPPPSVTPSEVPIKVSPSDA